MTALFVDCAPGIMFRAHGMFAFLFGALNPCSIILHESMDTSVRGPVTDVSSSAEPLHTDKRSSIKTAGVECATRVLRGRLAVIDLETTRDSWRRRTPAT